MCLQQKYLLMRPVLLDRLFFFLLPTQRQKEKLSSNVNLSLSYLHPAHSHACITINPTIHLWVYALLGNENTSFCLYLVQKMSLECLQSTTNLLNGK